MTDQIFSTGLNSEAAQMLAHLVAHVDTTTAGIVKLACFLSSHDLRMESPALPFTI
jgi:hypothetical protein